MPDLLSRFLVMEVPEDDLESNLGILDQQVHPIFEDAVGSTGVEDTMALVGKSSKVASEAWKGGGRGEEGRGSQVDLGREVDDD